MFKDPVVIIKDDRRFKDPRGLLVKQGKMFFVSLRKFLSFVKLIRE